MRILQTLALPLGHDATYTLYNKKDWRLKDFPIRNLFVERAMGFEPTTFSLARRRTTTVLRPQITVFLLTGSAETQDRTGDTAIFSRVLYQLSYLGQSILLLSVRDFTRTYIDCQETIGELTCKVECITFVQLKTAH